MKYFFITSSPGLVGLTVVPNFDYHNTITIGETLILILLLTRVLHHDASGYYPVSKYCRFLKNLDDFS